MNEYEYKKAAKARCSVTGKSCQCVGGGGCVNRQPSMDKPSNEAVRWLKAAAVHLDTVLQDLHEADRACAHSRAWPAPEARQWKRRVRALVEELEAVFQ